MAKDDCDLMFDLTGVLSNIRGSCGHTLPRWWHDSGVSHVSHKSYNQGLPCIVYASICPVCYAYYYMLGMLLFTKKQEDKWMKGKLPYYKCSMCGSTDTNEDDWLIHDEDCLCKDLTYKDFAPEKWER